MKSYSTVFPLWLSGSLRGGPGQNNIHAALHLTLLENAPPDTLSLSRRIKQFASILWSAENLIWSVFIALPSRFSSRLSILVVPITVFVYSYWKKERSEFDKVNLIYVVFAQTVWLACNADFIGLQELDRILLYLSVMITLNPSSWLWL